MNSKALQFLQRWLITTVAVMVAAKLVHGIEWDEFISLVVASLLLGILNAFLRPLLVLFSLPLMIYTLGLFYFVINALLLELVGHLVTGFYVKGFWPAFWGSLIISITSVILNLLTGTGKSRMKVQYRRGPPPPHRDDHTGNGPVIDV